MTASDMAPDDADRPLLFRSARSQLDALAAREISAVELLEEHLRHYRAVNPALNAVVATDLEGARIAAAAADAARAAGSAAALAGLPMTIKDVFEVVGMPATCGLPMLADHRPARDADAVAALRRADAVIWGKTNVPAGAVDHQSFNSVYGLTRNPWHLGRTPGGSSGGAAAAVAAGIAGLELGSDIGGSIRVPSHFCGVYGLKPSWGVVSGRGHIPPLPGARGDTPLGVYGPIARSAFDLELALDIIAGADELDRGAWSVRLPPARHDRLSEFRVGVWLDAYALDDGYRAAIESFVDRLERSGVRIDRRARPAIDAAESYATYLALLMALEGAGASDADYAAQIAAGRAAGDDASYAAVLGRHLSASVRDLGHAQARRDALIAAWRAFFDDCDLLICPIFPCVAFAHDASGNGHLAQYTRRLAVSGASVAYLDGLQWPGLVTLAELPAVAVPTGILVGGLPAGVQVIGPRLEDRTPLRFAQLVERELGGYRIPPLAT